MGYIQLSVTVEKELAGFLRFDLENWRDQREIPLRAVSPRGDWEIIVELDPADIGLTDKTSWEEAEYLLEDKEEFGTVSPELKELLSQYTWEEYIRKSIEEDDGTLLGAAQKYLSGEYAEIRLYY